MPSRHELRDVLPDEMPPPGTGSTGNGGNGNGDMRERLARLEAHHEHMATKADLVEAVSELKFLIQDLTFKVDRAFEGQAAAIQANAAAIAELGRRLTEEGVKVANPLGFQPPKAPD